MTLEAILGSDTGRITGTCWNITCPLAGIFPIGIASALEENNSYRHDIIVGVGQRPLMVCSKCRVNSICRINHQHVPGIWICDCVCSRVTKRGRNGTGMVTYDI